MLESASNIFFKLTTMFTSGSVESIMVILLLIIGYLLYGVKFVLVFHFSNLAQTQNGIQRAFCPLYS
jgi:hypothetical protein